MDIKVENIKKLFGDKVAVDIANLTINGGEIIGLVGNNGAGKTTFFRLLLDLLKADEGEVAYIDGESLINPAHSEEWKQSVGAYIDDGFLIDFLTAEEYFNFIGKVSGLTDQQIQEELKQYEKIMNGEVLGQKKLIRDFSAGNKHKIGIISALMTHPKIVILDEPFNFLDPSSQYVLKQMLREYSESHHATVIVSSHNLLHTIEISTRVLLMEKGHILKDLDNTGRKAEAELEDYFMMHE